MKINILILALSVFPFYTACRSSEHDHDPAVENKVTILIAKPVDQSTVKQGDSLEISGSISATAEIHGYEILVRNLSDSSVLLDTGEHDHITSATIRYKWKNPFKDSTRIGLEFKAVKDHAGNTESKSVQVFGVD